MSYLGRFYKAGLDLASLQNVAGVESGEAELALLNGVTAGTTTASKALVVGASKDLDQLQVGLLTIDGAATAADHPINLNSITAVTDAETTDFGNIIKVRRTGTAAVGGTHSGAIVKHYLEGGAVDGTAVVSGLYVNLKYQPTSENAAAEVSLIEAHLYSSASDAIDYGMYVLAPASKIDSLFGVSGTMTNFLEVKASGAAGMTVGADGMFRDPESHTEAGYLTIKVEGGASYEIPFYVDS